MASVHFSQGHAARVSPIDQRWYALCECCYVETFPSYLAAVQGLRRHLDACRVLSQAARG